MKAYGANIQYTAGYDLDKDEVDDEKIKQAQDAAKNAETAVVFAGLPDHFESEGYDREHLQIPENHRQLIEAVAAVQPNTVVVLSNGAPIEMPWLDQVKGVIESYLGGQAFGGAISDVLFGQVNPSGRLAETFPMTLSDNPSYLDFPGEADTVQYREGVFVGYRYYDTKNIQPLFPFGFGLSYTQFSYSDLQVNKKEVTDQEVVDVSVRVKNTGNRAGKEVVQLYVRDEESTINRPNKELKGFEKVYVEPGEEKLVTFSLTKRAFAYYHVGLSDWHVETGDFTIMIGKSSAEMVLEETIRVNSTASIPLIVHRNTLVGDLLRDRTLAPIAKELLMENSPFGDMASSDQQDGMMEAMLENLPLRAMVNFSMGAFTNQMLDDMIEKLNQANTHVS